MRPKKNASPIANAGVGGTPGRHLLVAEDEVINYLYLEAILTKKGYSVKHAKNWKEAVTLHRENPGIAMHIIKNLFTRS